MEQYISKSALVEEIEKKKIPFKKDIEDGVYPTYLCALMDFEDLIDTLEVKGVNLEKELDKEWNKCEPIDEGMGLEIASIEHEQFDNIAKYFFELGIKSKKGEL